MRLRVLVISMFIGLTFLNAVEAPAAVWYVDGQIAASGTGTSWADAKKTVQEAITDSVNGDEVWVRQGTYTLASTVSIAKEVKVYGGFAGTETSREQRQWWARSTVLDGQNARTCVVVNSKKAALDGFRIAKGSPFGISLGTCPGWVLEDATIIANCAIYDTIGTGVNCNNFVGIIRNCLIYNNTAYEGGGISLYNSAYPAIDNCTVYGNHADSYGGGISHEMDSYSKIINCIIWGNTADYGGAQIYKYGGTSSYTYCDIQGGYSGTGNINLDPKFVDPGANNFQLTANSPCIDVGNNTPTHFFEWNVLPATDYDGNPRIMDGNKDENARVDMGAYEYNPFKKGITTPLMLLLE